MSAYDPREILPTVQAACDHLIEEGFDETVFMRINDDGTITLIDRETEVNRILAARGDDDDE